MPQETTSAMTTYEIIATVIAIIALLQPWLIALYNRYFKKIKVTFTPSAKIKLYYNKSGAYIYLGGVIESQNKAAIVKDISVKLIRQNDRAELNLDWSSFMLPIFQSVGGNPVVTNEIARPFKVDANSLYPVFVEFATVNMPEASKLSEIYETIYAQARSLPIAAMLPEQAKQALAETECYKRCKDELLQNFYWKAADYIIELAISYNEKKATRLRYAFSIDAEEAAKFKGNIEKSLLCVIDDYYRLPTNFFYPQKEFIPVDTLE